MRERFEDYENRVTGHAESQITVSSAATSSSLPQEPAADRTGPVHHSQLLEPMDGDCHIRSVRHPETSLKAAVADGQTREHDGREQVDDPVNSAAFHPADLQDSQASTISALAYEARLHAFQTILENVSGKTGREIGLLSTTDNHSRMDPELYTVWSEP